MSQSRMISSAEMAQELGVSQSFAYKAIKQMNNELKSKGYLTVCGKVSRKYYEEKYYGFSEV